MSVTRLARAAALLAVLLILAACCATVAAVHVARLSLDGAAPAFVPLALHDDSTLRSLAGAGVSGAEGHTTIAAWARVHELIRRALGPACDTDTFRVLRPLSSAASGGGFDGSDGEVLSVTDLLSAPPHARFFVDVSRRAAWQRHQACVSGAVAAQYHAHPYPHVASAPASGGGAGDTGNSSSSAAGGFAWGASPLEVNHYLFRGQRWALFRDGGFRMLVAGAGTGATTLTAASALAELGSTNAVVFHLDVSATSIAAAQEAVLRHGLGRYVRFVQGSLLDAPAMLRDGVFGAARRKFHFVNCVGVLHHLASPVAGLRALAAVTEPGGGMFVGLYGMAARSGVYEAQRVVRMLARAGAGAGGEAWVSVDGADDGANGGGGTAAGSDGVRVLARALVDGGLPPTSPFVRNTQLFDLAARPDDAELMDILAHPCDRAYSVPEVVRLVASAGMAATDGQDDGMPLRLLGFFQQHQYWLPTFLGAPSLAKRLGAMSRLERLTVGELAAGRAFLHTFYVGVGESTSASGSADGVPVTPHSRLARIPGRSRVCPLCPDTFPAAHAVRECMDALVGLPGRSAFPQMTLSMQHGQGGAVVLGGVACPSVFMLAHLRRNLTVADVHAAYCDELAQAEQRARAAPGGSQDTGVLRVTSPVAPSLGAFVEQAQALLDVLAPWHAYAHIVGRN